MLNMNISINFYHSHFLLEIKQKKHWMAFTFIQKKSSELRVYFRNEGDNIHRNNNIDNKWEYYINTHLKKIDCNDKIKNLIKQIIYIRKKWKLILPLIIKLCKLTYQSEIYTRIFLLQNNFQTGTLSFIYDSTEHESYNNYKKKINNKLKTYLLDHIINTVHEYKSCNLYNLIKERSCICLTNKNSHHACIRDHLYEMKPWVMHNYT